MNQREELRGGGGEWRLDLGMEWQELPKERTTRNNRQYGRIVDQAAMVLNSAPPRQAGRRRVVILRCPTDLFHIISQRECAPKISVLWEVIGREVMGSCGRKLVWLFRLRIESEESFWAFVSHWVQNGDLLVEEFLNHAADLAAEAFAGGKLVGLAGGGGLGG